VTDRPLAVALVSGGMDSCVAAAIASRDHRLAFLHLNYRQRTERRELAAFLALADYFRAERRLVVDLSFMQQIGGTSLIDPAMAVPEDEPDPGSIPSTYVPFRNANLLGIAVAWAEVIGGEEVFIGAHQEESAYPDCRREFFAAYDQVIAAGIRPGRRLRVRTPLIDMDKAAIVRRGLELGAPFHLTWSCYQREDLVCGRCHSCRLRRRGFQAAGIEDPLPGAP
jgi:7-cyano-7-deazaguanine synthase